MPGEGDGGSQDGTDGGAGGGAGTRQRHKTRKIDRRIAELEREYGSKHAALHNLTSKLLTVEEENDALRAKLPGDGTVVLSKEDAATWAAYQKLGKPADLEATVKKAGELETKEAQRTKADTHRAHATKAGVQNADALVHLAASQGFDVTDVREEEQGGKKVKVLLVRPVGDDKAQAVPLTDFATQKGFSALLPALSVAPAGGSGGAAGGTAGGSSGTAGGAGGSGAQYPTTSGTAGAAAPTDAVGSFLERQEQRRQAKPSPFARAKGP